MWFSHPPVQFSSQSVMFTPLNLEQFSQAVKVTALVGQQVVESPRQRWETRGKALRGLLSPPLLHCTQPPAPMRHSARPPPYLSPFPCSPHPVTLRGGRKDLASLSWTLGLVPNDPSCYWDRVLVMGLNALFLLEICWMKRHSGLCVIIQQRPWKV